MKNNAEFIEVNDGVLIINLREEYDMQEFGMIVDLAKSPLLKNIKNIIINAMKLKYINIMGLEILSLKDELRNKDKYALVFCGLDSTIKEILESMDFESKYGYLINFNSLDEAKKIINNTP